ncbi:hypothetical protein K469DRAFT_690511 [Zopfia rhizophila CBS 207.26]|uniref:Serine-rich protein n=1 Tax=Zopfia rhizophila CBS 207.26 TaxID=1314779 RepID=A0A6A6DUQ3_9PEZI|nr:hypothetical protein K469DRAFT_690511 [Zopfia rhizophila CBS 207.26]
MSSNVNPSASTSKSPISSPLSRAPKFSPPSSRNTSPIRRPLHDRSNSQTNQYSGPTIRIVEDPGTDIYSKTPFPSQPSQILSPRNAPGYVFEGRGARVSDPNFVTNAVPKAEATQTLVPRPLQHKKAIRHSTSTSTSEADTIVASSFSPSSSRFSQGTTPPTSPPPDHIDKERGLEILEEGLRQPKKSTIRTVIPSSSSGGNPLEGHALTPRASAASLASTASSDTVTHRKHEHKRGSSSTSRSIPKAHKHTPSSGSDKKKQASSTNKAPVRPILKEASTESFAYSDISYASSDRPRSSSQPSPTIHDARQVTLASGVQLHYPVVRASSASGLWAESQNLPKNSSRMTTRASQVHHWSSQLSTIHSESERGSRSIERQSQSIDGRSQAQSQEDYGGNGRIHVPRRRQTIGSVASSDNVPSELTESSVSVPLPLFSPITRPSDERDSDEHHDTISPLQSPPLRKKRSGFLRRYDSDSRSSSSRPGSSQSDLSTFISNTIPAWARVYYRRSERTSLGAPDSSTEASESIRVPTAQSGRTNTPSEGNFPLSIYRPRNRPHQRMSHPESMSISEGPVEQEIYVIGPPRRPMMEPFTPRLRQDRRSTARLSAWKAPSFDDSLGSLFFGRQNRQILLFCLGFIFPLAWMIASILPLPPDPDLVQEPTPSQIDLERQFAQQLGPVDDRSYQKAMWWRNLNRIMSGIGTLLIGVIIALAVVASKM